MQIPVSSQTGQWLSRARIRRSRTTARLIADSFHKVPSCRTVPRLRKSYVRSAPILLCSSLARTEASYSRIVPQFATHTSIDTFQPSPSTSKQRILCFLLFYLVLYSLLFNVLLT